MSELNASNLRKEQGNEGPDLVGTTELTSPYFMVPPSGTTAQRPQNPHPGTLRFNTDIGSLEFFRGDTIGWESISRTTPNLGGGTGSNTGVGARGLWGGSGDPATGRGEILYITISTLGDSQVFGDLVSDRYATAGLGSRTRGVFAGGYNGGQTNTIEFVTFSSLGNTTDFGDMSETRWVFGSGSNATRGIFSGGRTPAGGAGVDVIDYITITTLGNAVDFGNLTDNRSACDAVTSPTRYVTGGGYNPGNVNIIDYVEIMTTGNAVDFGDLTYGRSRSGSCSNAHGGL